MDFLKDASLAGSVAMLFVFITGLSAKRTAKQKKQTGNTMTVLTNYSKSSS